MAKKAQKLNGMIATNVTNVKSNVDLESQRFTIGYEFYRLDLCEVGNMSHSPLRKVIDYFKQVSTCSTPLEVNRLGFIVKPVADAQTYKKYYKGFRDEDIELKELVAADSARHFFYVDPTRKIVQVIAHVNAHTPLGKQVK